MTIYDMGERIILIVGIGILILTLCLIYKIYLGELEEERIKERRKIKDCAKDTEKALKKANRRVKCNKRYMI